MEPHLAKEQQGPLWGGEKESGKWVILFGGVDLKK